MIRTFFRIAFRNIRKNMGFTFINIAGMATGLAAALLILLWVQDEFSYDKFNDEVSSIYRVEEDQFYSGERYHVTVTPFPSGPEWKDKIPEITDQTRINPWLPRVLFRYGENVFFESSIIAADSGFFEIFSFEMILGDPVTALRAPHSIVLAEKLANKYFGNRNPIGETLTVENKSRFTVTGVMKDPPRNSSIGFSAIIPFSYLQEIGAFFDGWDSNSIFTFVRIAHGSDIPSINKKLTDIVIEHVPQITTRYMLFPLADIHLHQQFGFTESRGAIMTVYIFLLISVVVVVIACINFINLSTARGAARAREIGIKKVGGASLSSLRSQFILESLLQVAAAMILAILLVGLLLGTFNNLTGKVFSLEDLFRTRFIAGYLLTGLFAGLVSGIYPAFYLSSFNPVSVLKGSLSAGKGNGRLRQVLVVIQFTLSMLIGISAVFMYLQLNYLMKKDLGYDRNNLISITINEEMKSKYYSLKDELEKETLIQGVTGSRWNPVSMGSNSGGAWWEGKDPDRNVLIGTNTVDYDYVKTLKMELVSGRDFSEEFPSDFARDTLGNFLINEEVAKIIGTGDPVGKSFRFMGLSGRVVGVMKNFHFKGADQPIEPMAFALSDAGSLNQMLIRLTPGDIASSLAAVEKVWKRVVPDYPLEYNFIDQEYLRLYNSETKSVNLLKYFTILAVIIACLGLYGLASWSARKRTNEVGVRKVMGADQWLIVFTLSREFLGLVLVSIILAVPLGWFVVHNLLEEFAFRIDINPLVFILIAAGAILVALLTVSFQALRAASVNPSQALKTE